MDFEAEAKALLNTLIAKCVHPFVWRGHLADALRRAYEAGQPKVDELEADCQAMATWFKDLIEDHYCFGAEDQPAYEAAIKYIPSDELHLPAPPATQGDA